MECMLKEYQPLKSYQQKKNKNIMDKFNLIEFLEEDERYKKGLYQAEVGDTLAIGIQGQSFKNKRKITKILPDGKVVDSDGNIFNPNGRLFRGGNRQSQKKGNPGKEISAKLVTQDEYNDDFKRIKIDFLRKFEYEKLDIEDILKIIDTIPNYSQANKLNTSRFTKR